MGGSLSIGSPISVPRQTGGVNPQKGFPSSGRCCRPSPFQEFAAPDLITTAALPSRMAALRSATFMLLGVAIREYALSHGCSIR